MKKGFLYDDTADDRNGSAEAEAPFFRCRRDRMVPAERKMNMSMMKKNAIASLLTEVLMMTAAAFSAYAGEVSSEQEDGGSNILVAYFTYGENAPLPDDVDASSSASIQLIDKDITGNTGLIAHWIAGDTGADLFSIHTVEQYPEDYNDTVDQGQKEKEEGARPEIADKIKNLDQYDTVFVGWPTWWYQMPMVMYTFFEEYDFSGKTIIPFCTSGGSSFSGAVEEIQSMQPDAEVLEGLHILDNDAADAKDQVDEWVSSLNLGE